ncbi:MAG: hypothetical protein H7Y04_12445 [Verrucomicrobia bacterium]|nr:hypothetical protein [Cytophagales bacterium]
MNKLTSLFLLFNYLIFSVGLVVPVHQCKITGKVSYFHLPKNGCQKSEKKACSAKMSGCCQNKILTFKLENTHKFQAHFDYQASVSVAVLPPFNAPIKLWQIPKKTIVHDFSLHPLKIPLYLRNKHLLV